MYLAFIGTSPESFQDLRAVMCAGKAVNADLDPYFQLSAACEGHVLNYFYPPIVAWISGAIAASLNDLQFILVFAAIFAAA